MKKINKTTEKKKIMIKDQQEARDQIIATGIKIYLEMVSNHKMKKILILIFQVPLVNQVTNKKLEKTRAKKIYLTDIMSNFVKVKKNLVKTQFCKKK
jgi:hypothetical protein